MSAHECSGLIGPISTTFSTGEFHLYLSKNFNFAEVGQSQQYSTRGQPKVSVDICSVNY